MTSLKLKQVLVLVGVAASPMAWAQETQNPAPSAPAIQSSDEIPSLPQTPGVVSNKLKTMTALRVLYFADPKTPRITVAVESPGQKPVILASSLPPWRGTDYQLFAPGKLKVHMLPGNVVPGDPNSPVNLSNFLAAPVEIELVPGTMGTVLINSVGGKLAATPIAETISQTGFPSVQVIHGGAKGEFGIYAKSGDSDPQGIWDSSKGKSAEIPLNKGPGGYSFLLTEKVDGADQARMVYESTLGPQDVLTLVVHEDKYGRIAMTALSNRLVDRFGGENAAGNP